MNNFRSNRTSVNRVPWVAGVGKGIKAIGAILDYVADKQKQ